MAKKSITDLPSGSLTSGALLPVQTGDGTIKSSVDDFAAYVVASAALQAAIGPLADAGDSLQDAFSNFATSTQTLLTRMAADIATHTNTLASHSSDITDLETRTGKLETLVLPAGTSAPTFSADPALTGTKAPGQTVTATVTISGETLPALRTYVYQVGGVELARIQGSGNNTYLIPAGVDVTKQITVTVISYNAAGPASKTSIGYPLTAGAAIPVVNSGSKPALTGSAASGSPLTVTRAGFTNSPTSFKDNFYRCGVQVSNYTGSGTASYTPGDTEKGLAISVGETATNGAGDSTPEVLSIEVVIAGGVAPDYLAAGSTPPGIVEAPGASAGVVLHADIGNPAVGNYDPRLTTIQWYAEGGAISSALGTSFNTTGYNRREISFGVILRNSAFPGAEARSPAYFVA